MSVFRLCLDIVNTISYSPELHSHILMTDTTILQIPLEVVYCIFDHCDTYTIFHSIRLVCKHFHRAVTNYKAHKLDFTVNSPYDFELIFRLTPPDSITSLIISNGERDRIARCISRIGTRRLTRLRSLALHEVSDKELKHFLENLITNALISLSIEWRHVFQSALLTLIVPAISQFNLRKLCLKNFDNVMEHKSWPKHSNIEHLTTGLCLYKDYPRVFNRMPQLRELVIGECRQGYHSATISASDLEFQPQLVSLTINQCRLYYHDLELLLSLSSGIHHLKLICDSRSLKPIFDGSYWEKLISSKLPLLDNFEFSFLYELSKEEHSPLLDKLIASFQTPYWLDKHWFVTCEYNIDTRELRLYRSDVICLHQSTILKKNTHIDLKSHH